MIEGFAAVDGALFVVDASAGMEAGLEQAVSLGRSTGRAACFFINKSDRENADPTATLDALRSTFGDKIAPLQIAIGAARSFDGYVDLVHRKAYHWDGTKEVEIPIPDELRSEFDKRDQLLAAAAEADDDVAVKYLEGEEVSDPELEACLRKGVKETSSHRCWSVRHQGHRPPGAARRLHALPALPRGRGARQGTGQGRHHRRDPVRRGRTTRPRLQDDRRPVRRPPDVHARALRRTSVAGPRLEQHT